MTEIYGMSSRPTRLSIIGEVESATLVERQEGVPVNAHEALVEKQNSARGYNVGGLSQARAAFSQKRGVTGSWEPSR